MWSLRTWQKFLGRKRKEGLTGMRWHCRRLLQRKRTVKRMINVVLLGEEFKPKWKGPTRLLLLDEANEDTRDLPESIKVFALQHFDLCQLLFLWRFCIDKCDPVLFLVVLIFLVVTEHFVVIVVLDNAGYLFFFVYEGCLYHYIASNFDTGYYWTIRHDN